MNYVIHFEVELSYDKCGNVIVYFSLPLYLLYITVYFMYLFYFIFFFFASIAYTFELRFRYFTNIISVW